MDRCSNTRSLCEQIWEHSGFFYPKNRMIRLYQVWFDVLWVKDTILMAMKKIRI